MTTTGQKPRDMSEAMWLELTDEAAGIRLVEGRTGYVVLTDWGCYLVTAKPKAGDKIIYAMD